jgi:hypothetical protein
VGEALGYIGEWIETDRQVQSNSLILSVHHVTFTLPKFRPIVERAPGRLLHPQASTIARGRNTIPLPNPPKSRLKPLISPLALLKSCLEATIPSSNLSESYLAATISCLRATISPLNLPKSCLRATIPSPNLPESCPKATIPLNLP